MEKINKYVNIDVWTIHYYSQAVQNWIKVLPVGLRADYARLADLLVNFGADLRLPHSRAMGKGLFELRLKGKEGIARLLYSTRRNREIVILHGFIKKTEKTPKRDLAIALQRMHEVNNE